MRLQSANKMQGTKYDKAKKRQNGSDRRQISLRDDKCGITQYAMKNENKAWSYATLCTTSRNLILLPPILAYCRKHIYSTHSYKSHASRYIQSTDSSEHRCNDSFPSINNHIIPGVHIACAGTSGWRISPIKAATVFSLGSQLICKKSSHGRLKRTNDFGGVLFQGVRIFDHWLSYLA